MRANSLTRIQHFLNEKVDKKYVRITSWMLASIPIVYYFTVFFTYQVNVPHEDDYDTVLGFMNTLVIMESFAEKVWWCFYAIANEHILFFNHVRTWIYHEIAGEVNFNALTTIGCIIVLISWMLLQRIADQKIVKAHDEEPIAWIKAFVLISGSMLIFNFSYYEAIFRTTDQFQKIGVVIYAILAISAFTKNRTTIAVALASTGMLFNANGIFIPLCILFLCFIDPERRSWRNMLFWMTISIIVILFYAYMASLKPAEHIEYIDLTQLADWVQLIKHYFAYCGSSMQMLGPYRDISIFFGLLMNGFFFFVLIHKRKKENLLIYGFIAFMLLSFAATSYGRSVEGYLQAFSSRYKIYASILFLSFIILLMTNTIKYRLPFIIAITFAIIWTLPKIHNRSFPKIKERSIGFEYMINHFTFDASDSIKLNYSPNQIRPREVLKESAILGIYTNDHIKELLKQEAQK